MPSKASKKRKKRQAAGIVNQYKKTKKDNSVLMQDRGERRQSEISDNFAKEAIHVYRDGRWLIVDNSSEDFPIAIKMTITPEWAWDVVCNRNHKNRNPRQNRIDKYVQDIINGNWYVINNGIAFCKDGSLADGQHRLLAIASAQRPVEAFVIFGLDKKAIPSIDEGASRAMHDVAQMIGMEAKGKHFAVTNYILEMKGVKRSTPKHEAIEMFSRHKDAVNFAIDRLNKTGIAKAPVMAACMRAYYSIDRCKLERFLEVLQNGVVQGEHEQPAIALRNYLLANKKSVSGAGRLELYRKTEYALVKFIEGVYISRLYGLKDEQFPIPEDRLAGQLV